MTFLLINQLFKLATSSSVESRLLVDIKENVSIGSNENL